MVRTTERLKYLNNNVQCAYCDQSATTKDHVVPRSLFVPPLPLDMITVPCCGPCNANKKQVDDFLRDYLVAIDVIEGDPSEIAETIKIGSLQRAVNRGQSKLHKELGAIEQIVDSFSDRSSSFKAIVKPLMQEYMRFAVKGLFYAKAKMRIPADHEFLMAKLDGIDGLADYYDSLARSGPVNEFRIGDQRVFGCFSQIITSCGNLSATFWGIVFYNTTFISCSTVSPEIQSLLPETILDDLF